MKEWHLSHGYDGFSMSLVKRKWYKIWAEESYNKLLAVMGHPCCGNGIWKYILWGEWGGLLQFRLLNNHLTNWSWREDSHISLPLASSWVRETFPDIFDPESKDYWDLSFIEEDTRDPNHGDKCPKCGQGRVNDNPKKSIEKYGHCLRCEIAVKITEY